MSKLVLGMALAVAALYIAVREGLSVLEGSYTPMEIVELNRRSHEFDGRRVTVSGTVIYSAAIMGVGGYFLRQGSAEILIVGAGGMPQAGSKIVVSGTFKQALAVNGVQYAMILQK